MSPPTPRPALRRAADADVHPAAPGHSPPQLRHAADLPVPRPDSESAPTEGPEQSAPLAPSGKAGKGHRLSGPPSGTTSDMLRAAGKRGRRAARGLPAEKSVELTVKVPKSLRKEFRAAVKANRADPDEVVTSLLRAWLHG